MNTFWIIAGATLLIYLCRVSGFILPIAKQSRKWEQVLHLLPIIIFSVLFISPLVRQPDLILAKFLSLFVTAVIVWRTGQLGVAIFVGFVVFYVLSNV